MIHHNGGQGIAVFNFDAQRIEIGYNSMLLNGDAVLLADTVGARWYDMFRASPEGGFDVFMEVVRSGQAEIPQELIRNPALKRSAHPSTCRVRFSFQSQRPA